MSVGYVHDPAHDHVRRLKQVLEARGSVAPDAMFSVAELATMFGSARQQPLFCGMQRAFERFLAACGRLVVEPDCNRFTPFLDAYRRHLLETRGLAAAAAGQRLKRQSLQHTIAQLRAFLRFCHDHGELRERLDIIDTPRTYRDEMPPRALAWNLVQKLFTAGIFFPCVRELYTRPHAFDTPPRILLF